MTDYQIIIKNQSEVEQRYLLFNEPPIHKDGFRNVWIRTTGTPGPHGTQHLVLKPDVFAICGTLSQPLAEGAVVSEGDNTPVTVAGHQPGTIVEMNIIKNSPALKILPSTTTEAGRFFINTGDWDADRYKDKVWCGMGRRNDKGDPVPVSTLHALPNENYGFTPVNTFYLVAGQTEVGTIITVEQLSKEVKIDFTLAKTGQTIATIIQNSDMTYSTPVFSYPDD